MSHPTHWIWLDLPNPDAPHQYVEFRRSFELSHRPSRARLRISADTNFVVWVNGGFAATGQFSDFPDQRTHSEIDVLPLLRPGVNVLGVLAHYCGVDHFSYLPGHAGLWYELEVEDQIILRSDARTRGRPSPCYRQDLVSRITAQRAFTFHYDSGGEDGWRQPDYREAGDWSTTAATADAQAPRARPLAMCEIQPRVAGRIIAQGLLKRPQAGAASVAELMQRDYLSARRSWELFVDQAPISAPVTGPVSIRADRLEGAEGFYVVYDLGREECGLIDLELASDGGCVIDVAVGEHLDDLRVRSHVGGRNFASRYVARPSEQRFTHHLDRYAGRYVQLHVTGLSGTLSLRGVGLAPMMYPVHAVGSFTCDDSLANHLWRTAMRTIHLCMHEHFEDCPWREQALYANDARNQMLSVYHAFADYDFARVSLDLLARTTGDDGYQQLCAPMKFELTIPSFTLTWFLAADDYLRYSGDVDFIGGQMPAMRRSIGHICESLSGDLLACPQGGRYWHFYDWAAGLDGTVSEDCTRFDTVSGERWDGPLNLYLVLALEAMARMATAVGDGGAATEYRRQADRMKTAIHNAFWCDQSQAYATYRDGSGLRHQAQLTQALAILAQVGDAERRGRLRDRLAGSDPALVATTLSQSLYKYEAILLDPRHAATVFQEVMNQWSAMLLSGATSFWETRRGGWDFHHAASLCHGWSGLPGYLYSAYGLGVRPIEPGFRRFTVNPLPIFSHAAGTIPTPHGPIRVQLSWRDGDCQPKIEAPSGTQATA